MAQAQAAFETDFWKDANLRKVWDDIIPGEPRKTIPYVLTKEAIELLWRVEAHLSLQPFPDHIVVLVRT